MSVAGIHLVTDERLPVDRLLSVVDAAVGAGVRVVQLRAKHATARELVAQAVALSSVVAGRASLLVDDRLDVVLAARGAGARVDGVHLGQSDVPPETARRHLGATAIVGWTASTPEHLAAAAAMPVGTLDYLGVGVLRATATKPDHPPALGVAGIRAVAAATDLRCIAIGGVDVRDVPGLAVAGLAGVAVVSAVSAAADPRAAAAALVAAWQTAAGVRA
ncbi:thiamine phosphate synthase [Agrococcus jejuensis]|uniref:Thiamine-phosphate synthase n=1 Tax=Agrococcus jejuensis TaxID=399736 RepID=A0A1G8AF37_9MICO|nr:thiamine phosphate synthase [Agrococcus jejuensis]SDH19635.1 thiamine-phosphate pyrophosphorylase [Agrococcus jejuensis]